MTGYLESYGAGEAQRAKREQLIKRVVVALAIVLAAGGVAWFMLRNYREDAQVSRFVELLKKKDYPTAYKMWGCSVESPCRDYNYDRFLEDWGNKGTHADASAVTVEKTRNCNGGIIRKLKYPGDSVLIFVSRSDLQLSFSPWEEACEVRLKAPAN